MVESPTAVDQSWSSLSPASARARGIKIVWDYLSHDPSKDWTAPQIKNYLAAGVACGFLWETTANRALNGGAAGLADGRDAAAALNGLIRAVGITPPSKLSIIAAVDFDTNPSQYPTIKAYTSNFRAGLAGQFLTGIYGEADLLDALGSLIDVGFQTYAWSRGRISTRAALYQYLNGQSIDGAIVDYDRIIRAAELGAWWPAGLVPASGGATPISNTPATEDDDLNNGDLYNLFFAPITGPDGTSVGTGLDLIRKAAYSAGVDASNAAILPSVQEGVADGRSIEAKVDQLLGATGTPPTTPGAPVDLQPVLDRLNALPAALVAAIKEAL